MRRWHAGADSVRLSAVTSANAPIAPRGRPVLVKQRNRVADQADDLAVLKREVELVVATAQFPVAAATCTGNSSGVDLAALVQRAEARRPLFLRGALRQVTALRPAQQLIGQVAAQS